MSLEASSSAASTPSSSQNSQSSQGSEANTGEGSETQEGQGREQQAEPKEKKKPVPKMRKLNINGRDEYVDEDQVFRDYQKNRAGDHKLKEANQKLQEAAALEKRLREDPYSVLKDPKYSVKTRELAERMMIEHIEEEMNPKDPRDEELEHYKQQLKEFQDRDLSVKEQEEQTAQQARVEQSKTKHSTIIHEAMQMSPMSKDPAVMAEMVRDYAVHMRACMERGEDVPTAAELVQHLEGNRRRQFYALAQQHDGSDLIDMLGEDVVNKIRKADIARIKASRNQPVQSFRSEGTQNRSNTSQYIDPADAIFAARRNR